MSEKLTFDRVDIYQVEDSVRAQQSVLHIRWWTVLVVIALCVAQAVLNRIFVSRPRPLHLISTQISVISFAFLAFITLIINPLMRRTRIIKPFNRAELISMFAAMFVSASIASYGMIDMLIPLIQAPFNPQWNLPQAGWQDTIIPHLNENLFITDTEAIFEYRQGLGAYSGIMGQIPWALWLKPISLWLIFFAAMYGIFYSISILFFDNWARREKVVFPLARLPEYIVHEEDSEPGAYPARLKTGLFWIGFIIVFALVSFNAAASVNWLRGLNPIPMGIPQEKIMSMLLGTFLEGIGGRMRFFITFTVITIGYLIPNKIGVSIWSYQFIGTGLMLLAIWTGFGGSERSFPSDYIWESNFLVSMAGGGVLAFALSYIVKLFHEKWVDLAHEGLANTRRFYKTIASLGPGGALAAASAIVGILWLWWAGVPPLLGFLYLSVVILITITLMRVVAESGIFSIQLHAGPLHLAYIMGGSSAVPGYVLAPLMPIHSALFLDIKTFIAPGILNSFKMQDSSRSPRRMFHFIVITGMVVTVAAAIMATLIISYYLGANQSPPWFFTHGPMRLLNSAQRLATTETGRISPNLIFYALGAAWVVMSLVMRRRIFWWLHPVGFLMLANPFMQHAWFSYFVGWLLKRLAVKYGGRHAFEKYLPLFIGLMMGELMAIFVWAVIGHVFNLEGLTGIAMRV